MMFMAMSTAFNNLKTAQNSLGKRQRKERVFRLPSRECTWATMLREEGPLLGLYFYFQIRLNPTDFVPAFVCPFLCFSASWTGSGLDEDLV